MMMMMLMMMLVLFCKTMRTWYLEGGEKGGFIGFIKVMKYKIDSRVEKDDFE